MEINTPRRVPGEKSEFSHFHFRPAWLCWSSARSLGLNFLCCGRDTTRTFIVHDELPSSEEQQLFWAHETRGSVPRRRAKWWPLNEGALLFGPAWLAAATGSELYSYRGSPPRSNAASPFPLMSSGAGDGEQSHSFVLHVHIYVKQRVFADADEWVISNIIEFLK